MLDLHGFHGLLRTGTFWFSFDLPRFNLAQVFVSVAHKQVFLGLSLIKVAQGKVAQLDRFVVNLALLVFDPGCAYLRPDFLRRYLRSQFVNHAFVSLPYLSVVETDGFSLNERVDLRGHREDEVAARQGHRFVGWLPNLLRPNIKLVLFF